ncbi:MAG: signal peptidase II [Candidatus Shapirobacteria bacterium]|nr:signal peptidase II [Candidatus Shapirobacteria bacterium]
MFLGCFWLLHGIIADFLGLGIENKGISFGWDGEWVFWSSLVSLLWLGYFWWKKESNGVWLMLVGGLINFTDRLVLGYVRDYWCFGPVYNNIADWIIFVGVGVFVWELWKKKLK